MLNLQVGQMTVNGTVLEIVPEDGTGQVSGRARTVFDTGTLYHAFREYDPETGLTGTFYSSYWEDMQ